MQNTNLTKNGDLYDGNVASFFYWSQALAFALNPSDVSSKLILILVVTKLRKISQKCLDILDSITPIIGKNVKNN